MAENVVLRFIDKIGLKTLDGATAARRRIAEFSTALSEQEEAVTSIREKQAKEKDEKKRAMEEMLAAIKESVSLGVETEEEEGAEIKRDELEVPFSVRLSNVISDMASGPAKGFGNFFGNIQEDLYRANIIMPASKYIALSIGISAIIAGVFGIVGGILLSTLMGGLGAVVGVFIAIPVFFIGLVVAKTNPSSKVKARSDAFGRELPFALRHMATQLISGSGLLETMRSVADSGYGVLSEEFKRAILEVERGATIEESFERMILRIDSESLKKVARQIISTLRTGGNLANTLKVMAEEISMEMRMKLKDFIQVLNTFTLMYMFVVVVAPVLMTTMMVAMGIAMGSQGGGLPVPADVMWMLYMAFFGIAVYMSIMVKKFEPKV
ncbi:MAG: type II secretion system F family protein [Candidatus Hydrothermarchaeales archaeon]